MAGCVACSKALTLDIEPEEEEAGSSASNGSYVDDDVQLQCGLQENLDILPILTEESYLKAYPEERKPRAFLEFCGEGDIEAIVDLLDDQADNNDDEDEEMTTAPRVGPNMDVLRYQDQIGSMGTGLHVAIQKSRAEVAWLLLFLASTLEMSQFPQGVLEAAKDFGLSREDQSGKADIRTLRDAEGCTAVHLAIRVGGMWKERLQSGRLKAPAD